jgi:hypothetical protein
MPVPNCDVQPITALPVCHTESETTVNRTPVLAALYILGAAFLLCVGGIVWLASANPAREIPDVLVATTTGILGLIGGILVPSRQV